MAVQDIQWIDDRLERLAELLPDLMGKLELMKAEMMLTLVANCEVGSRHPLYPCTAACQPF